MFKKIPLNNNGIDFSWNDKNSISKAIYFLNDFNYDIDKSDIDNLYRCIRINGGHGLISNYFDCFANLLNKRLSEIKTFNEILISNDYKLQQQYVLLYKNIPYRDSKKIEIESYLISKEFNYNISSYDDLLLFFQYLLNSDNNILYNQRSFVFNEKIDFSSFQNNSKIKQRNIYPSDDEIVSNFEVAKMLYGKGYKNLTEDEKNFYNQAVGMYFEREVYNYEYNYLCGKKRSDLAKKMIWVSKDVGDGFGYDILSFNPETEKEKLIEVKGSLSHINTGEIELTHNEMRQFLNSFNMNDSNYSSDYYVYKCMYLNSYMWYYIIGSKKDAPYFNIVDINGTEFTYDEESYKNKAEKIKIKVKH